MTALPRRIIGALAAARVLLGGAIRTRGAVVLGYHDVDDSPTNATTYLTTPDLLRSQLKAVIGWGVSFVELGELCDRHARGESLDGLAAVSFDDGLVGVWRHALPILLELGVPATVFAVADPSASMQPWPGRRPMNDDELRGLASEGITIGSHTMSHASLPGLSSTALRRELGDARTRLGDVLERRVDLLAYPYGHHDTRVRAAARDVGYRAACTFLNGRLTTTVDPYRIPRLTMNSQSPFRLAYHLARPASSWPDHQFDTVVDRVDRELDTGSGATARRQYPRHRPS
jgi:peptidoglycan/xylan/chitin deacetylase (PgdA/CDA1 family)